jgi:hypothetical protein
MRQTSHALASTKSACSAFSHESHAALIAHLFSYGDPRGVAQPSVEQLSYSTTGVFAMISNLLHTPDGRRFIPVIRYVDGDELIHTDEHLFCSELDCLCHHDPANLAQLASWVRDGLMTQAQADRYFQGQVL